MTCSEEEGDWGYYEEKDWSTYKDWSYIEKGEMEKKKDTISLTEKQKAIWYDGLKIKPSTALNTQVGGNHYKDMKIQPMEFSYHNKLDPLQHTIIKYVCRFRSKNGKIDLEKARHTLDMLIQLEYGE